MVVFIEPSQNDKMTDGERIGEMEAARRVRAQGGAQGISSNGTALHPGCGGGYTTLHR